MRTAPAPAAVFRYRALDRSGATVRGRLRAASEEAVNRELTRRGLFPLSVRPGLAPVGSRGVPRQDLAVLFRGIASLTRTGMPVERAMAASELLVGGALRDAVGSVRQRVREGATVAEALEASPDVFPPMAIGMVRAGERGSRLSDALQALAEQLEEDAQLRSRVRSALAYPALIVVVGVVSIGVMGLVVVPRFAEVLTDLGGELPGSTRLLIAVSNALRHFGLLGVLGGAVLYAGWLTWLRTPEARRRVDALLLRLPLVGSIRMGFASARVCRALGAMLRSGMPLLTALDVVGDTAGDAEVSRRLAAARASVARGEPLTASLEREGVLSPLALQLVGVGEASGELGSLASQAGDISAERAGRTLRAAVGLLEPALVIGLGLLVALVAAALLQAVYSVRP